MTQQAKDITVGSVLPRVLALFQAEGLPEMALGDFYDEAKKAMPEFDPKRTIMLDDGSQGWYIAIRLAAKELDSGDSMRLFATHLRGYVNLDVDLPVETDSNEVDDAKIMSTAVRAEVEGGTKAYARLGVEFLNNGEYVRVNAPTKWVEIDLSTGDLKLCAF